jgi:hypothetical protein
VPSSISRGREASSGKANQLFQPTRRTARLKSDGTEVPDETVTHTLGPSDSIAWTPYPTTNYEMEYLGVQIPNASFAYGSIKIEADHPIVGRALNGGCSGGTFVSTAAEPFVEECTLPE